MEKLISDIQEQAEQIRRERLPKLVKKAEEVPRVLVGNLVGEGHIKLSTTSHCGGSWKAKAVWACSLRRASTELNRSYGS